ncbi:MAG: hypothetical protein ACRD2W_07145 [Acidimicrobiales bacterium]
MRIRATATVAVLAVFLVLLTGCGGGKKKDEGRTTTTRFPPTVPVTNIDLAEGSGICGYLTQSDVRTATGIASQPGAGSRAATNEACRWSLQGTNQFVLLLSNTGGASTFDRFREGATVEDLPGVADRAFVVNDTAYALKGEKVLILQVATTQPIPARKQAAINLMKMAAPRA